MTEAPHRRQRLAPLRRQSSLWLVCGALSACANNVEDGRSEGSIPLPSGTRSVRITLEKGSISVLPSDQPSIEWQAAFRKGTTDAVDLPLLAAVSAELVALESDGSDQLQIDGPRVPAALAARDPGAVVALKLVVRVPRDLSVVLRTERGPVGVSDRDASVEIHTGSGNLLIENVRGDATAFSGAGSHMVIDHSGGLDLSTQRGDFLVYVDALAAGGIKLHTEAGSIQCNLPPGSGFRLDASARRGEVESGFEVPVERLENGQRQTGVIGAGGPPVRVSSKLGSVSVRYGSRDPANR